MTQSKTKPLAACFDYTFSFLILNFLKLFYWLPFMWARLFKGGSVSLLFPPILYFPRWSHRGSTDPSISGCLDSLPPVHHGADPGPPSRSLHLPGGRCRCCSPPRPGEGPTGVCFSYLLLFFPSTLSSKTHSALTIQGVLRHTEWMPARLQINVICVESCSVQKGFYVKQFVHYVYKKVNSEEEKKCNPKTWIKMINAPLQP